MSYIEVDPRNLSSEGSEAGVLPFLASEIKRLIRDDDLEGLQSLMNEIAKLSDNLVLLNEEVDEKRREYKRMRNRMRDLEEQERRQQEARKALLADMQKEFGIGDDGSGKPSADAVAAMSAELENDDLFSADINDLLGDDPAFQESGSDADAGADAANGAETQTPDLDDDLDIPSAPAGANAESAQRDDLDDEEDDDDALSAFDFGDDEPPTDDDFQAAFDDDDFSIDYDDGFYDAEGGGAFDFGDGGDPFSSGDASTGGATDPFGFNGADDHAGAATVAGKPAQTGSFAAAPSSQPSPTEVDAMKTFDPMSLVDDDDDYDEPIDIFEDDGYAERIAQEREELERRRAMASWTDEEAEEAELAAPSDDGDDDLGVPEDDDASAFEAAPAAEPGAIDDLFASDLFDEDLESADVYEGALPSDEEDGANGGLVNAPHAPSPQRQQQAAAKSDYDEFDEDDDFFSM